MKRVAVLSIITIVSIICAELLFASVAIRKKHVGLKKNGVAVNFTCNYCHQGTGISKDEGSKQGYMKGQPKYASLRNISKCSGGGCHN